MSVSSESLGVKVGTVPGSNKYTPILAVRDDSLDVLSQSDGQMTYLRVNNKGALHTVSTGGGGGGGGGEPGIAPGGYGGEGGTAGCLQFGVYSLGLRGRYAG